MRRQTRFTYHSVTIICFRLAGVVKGDIYLFTLVPPEINIHTVLSKLLIPQLLKLQSGIIIRLDNDSERSVVFVPSLLNSIFVFVQRR